MKWSAFRKLFLPLPTGEKWAVWPKDLKLFSQCPLDSSGLLNEKIFIFSFLQYPLDKTTVFDQKDLKFFSSSTQRTRGTVLNEKERKSPRKFSEAVEKFILLCYNTAILQQMMCKGDAIMSFQAELKRIRQRCFLSQQAFAKEINVAFPRLIAGRAGRQSPI